MAKITFQDALPRRPLYEDASPKPTRLKAAPVPSSDDASSADILSAARAEAAAILTNARARATDILSVAAPAVPVPYLEWIARIGLTAVDAAALLGATRQSAHMWSKPDGEAPLHVRQRLALIERIGLDAARTILSGLDA